MIVDEVRRLARLAVQQTSSGDVSDAFVASRVIVAVSVRCVAMESVSVVGAHLSETHKLREVKHSD